MIGPAISKNRTTATSSRDVVKTMIVRERIRFERTIEITQFSFVPVTLDAARVPTYFGAEEAVLDGLLSRFEARIDDARRFALRNRAALLRATNRIPVDVALGALDFEQRAVERASLWDVKEAQLLACSAEDLIVHTRRLRAATATSLAPSVRAAVAAG